MSKILDLDIKSITKSSIFYLVFLKLMTLEPSPTTNSRAYYHLFYVNGDTVSTSTLCNSSGTNYSTAEYAVRPVVEIDLSKVNVGLTGDGNADTAYSIEAK